MNKNKKLLVIQLSGGNDGLNTFVPFENDIYYNLRPKIGIRKNELLSLDDLHGFNSSLSFMHKLYLDGSLSIINNVGYPDANRSHFHSMDVWQSALLHDHKNTTGWLGRYLDIHKDQFNTKIAAIETSTILSTVLKGAIENGVCVNDFLAMQEEFDRPLYENIISRIPHLESDSTNELSYIYRVIQDGHSGIDYLCSQYNTHEPTIQFSKAQLAKDLKLVADLIVSEVETQFFYVPYGSFDTHVGQQNKHPRLLKTLDHTLLEFIAALEKYDKLDELCILIFSEFGRRVKENNSKGTDHGAASNCYVICNQLRNPGIFNALHDLSSLDEGDIPFDIDFRRIYATILEDWLEVESKDILHERFEKLDLFSPIIASV